METPDESPQMDTPETARDPEIERIVQETAEAMSLRIGYIDGLSDDAIFRRNFPCEVRRGESGVGENIRRYGY